LGTHRTGNHEGLSGCRGKLRKHRFVNIPGIPLSADELEKLRMKVRESRKAKMGNKG